MQKNLGWYLLVPILLVGTPAGKPHIIASAAPDLSGHNRVAGHDVRKVLTQRNTGLDLEGLSAILEDRRGDFWMTTYSNLYRCNRNQEDWRAYDFPLDPKLGEVSSLNKTADDTVWLSGRAGGLGFGGFVATFNGTIWRSLGQEIAMHPEAPIPNDDLKHFRFAFPGREQREWLVFCDLHSRSYMLAFDGSQWSARIELPSQFIAISSGFEDSQGSIWLSAGDIWRFDKQGSKWQRYQKPWDYGSTYLYEDHDGGMWFVCSAGSVEVFDRRNDQWRRFTVSDYLPARAKRPNKVWEAVGAMWRPFFPVHAIYQDVQRQMVFSTSRGLITLDRSADNWAFFDTENSALPGAIISAIFEDKAGRIWLGTSEGIVILDQ